MKIGSISVGLEHEPLIIAEIGINHGGSLEVAKLMVDAAVRAGIKVIKHQTHVVEDEMSLEARKNKVGYIGKSIFDLMDECSLSEEDEKALMEYTLSKNAVFLSTPFSRAAANRLQSFGLPAFKIGSGECNNYPLVKHIASFGKPIILSTGMNDLSSITISVDILRSAGVSFALLHTTNIYPTPPHLVRLGAIQELKAAFPDAIIGLSDHTTSNHACFGAVAMGASILERHFTDTMTREGPDIICSMDEKSAKDLVDGSRILFLERGGEKKPVEEEKAVIDFAFASVVAINDIKTGDALSEKNIWVKRPGTGPFFAKDYEKLIGRVADKHINSGEHIAEDMLKKV